MATPSSLFKSPASRRRERVSGSLGTARFPGRSTRMTSAPWSASIIAAKGPGPRPAISMIFKPASGPGNASPSLWRRLTRLPGKREREMLETSTRTIFDDSHEAFRDTVRRVFADTLEPNLDRYEKEGIVEREAWEAAGAAGLLCPGVPEAYGGPGLDFRFNAIVGEELAYLGAAAGFTLQSDIVADYLIAYGSEEQKQRHLPGMVSGETITAIAMTEPGAGSDLQAMKTIARPDGNGWSLSGSKTYITNGQSADLVIVCARTTEEGGAKGISLFLVEAGDEGFSRGRNLDKIGLHGNDTSELFFDAVKLPADRLLGKENGGF